MHVKLFDMGDWISLSSKFVKFRDLKMLGKRNHSDGSVKGIWAHGLKLERLGIVSLLNGF